MRAGPRASTRSASASNACAASPSGSDIRTGTPSSAPRRTAGTRGIRPRSGTSSVVGQSVAPTGAEELVARTVVAGEPRHVLDDTPHGQRQLLGRVRRALGHSLGRRLRGGDHDDLGPREVLAERQSHVTGPRRHVDEKEVRLPPVGVDQELLERLVQHRSAPDHRLFVGDEEAHRQATHPVHHRRHQEFVDGHRAPGHTEHLGDREAVDVGVEKADLVAPCGERHRQVHGHRRLPHSPLARRDADHARPRPGDHEAIGSALLVVERTGRRPRCAGFGVRVAMVVGPRRGVTTVGPDRRPGRRGQAQVQRGALVVAHHHHVDVGGAGGEALENDTHGLCHGGGGRPPGHRHGEDDAQGPALDPDGTHHAQLPDGPSQVGVLDCPDRSGHLCFARGHRIVLPGQIQAPPGNIRRRQVD